MAEQFLDRRRSAPPSSRWVAALWRRACGPRSGDPSIARAARAPAPGRPAGRAEPPGRPGTRPDRLEARPGAGALARSSAPAPGGRAHRDHALLVTLAEHPQRARAGSRSSTSRPTSSPTRSPRRTAPRAPRGRGGPGLRRGSGVRRARPARWRPRREGLSRVEHPCAWSARSTAGSVRCAFGEASSNAGSAALSPGAAEGGERPRGRGAPGDRRPGAASRGLQREPAAQVRERRSPRVRTPDGGVREQRARRRGRRAPSALTATAHAQIPLKDRPKSDRAAGSSRGGGRGAHTRPASRGARPGPPRGSSPREAGPRAHRTPARLTPRGAPVPDEAHGVAQQGEQPRAATRQRSSGSLDTARPRGRAGAGRPHPQGVRAQPVRGARRRRAWATARLADPADRREDVGGAGDRAARRSRSRRAPRRHGRVTGPGTAMTSRSRDGAPRPSPAPLRRRPRPRPSPRRAPRSPDCGQEAGSGRVLTRRQLAHHQPSSAIRSSSASWPLG